jgi:Tol biopolymer transport system component
MLDPGNLGARSVGSDALIGCSAWSPDGATLLCSVESGQHKTVDGIYSILADGSGLTRLTTTPYHDTSGPAGECGGGDGETDYSSDGAQFVFMRRRCGTGADPWSDESAALYVENIDGTGLRKIVDYGQASSYPGSSARWSPDGSEILFGDPDGFLWLVHPDGPDLTQIHLDVGGVRNRSSGPDWSPDGQSIVFSMYLGYGPPAALFVARPDGTNVTRVTNTPAYIETLPNWGTNP